MDTGIYTKKVDILAFTMKDFGHEMKVR